MKRKHLSFIVVIVIMIMVLTACGGNKAAQAPTESDISSQPQESALPPADTAQETKESATQEPVAPQENPQELPEEPTEPEVRAPEMVEITMDNWQKYLEIVTYDTDDGYFRWMLAVKDDVAEQYKQFGDYDIQDVPENAPEEFLDMYGRAADIGEITAKIQVTVTDTSIWDKYFPNHPKEYTCHLGTRGYVVYLTDRAEHIQAKFDNGAYRLDSIICKSEEEKAILIDAIQIEMTEISGTIPVWR